MVSLAAQDAIWVGASLSSVGVIIHATAIAGKILKYILFKMSNSRMLIISVNEIVLQLYYKVWSNKVFDFTYLSTVSQPITKLIVNFSLQFFSLSF